MNPLQSLYTTSAFLRLSTITWLEMADILLLVVTFYIFSSLVYRSQVAFLLRGVLILGTIIFLIAIFLPPLLVFDWILFGLLGAMVIAIPIIFQPELRHVLERMGRATGMTPTFRQSIAETIPSRIVRAVEHMSSTRTGALIAFESKDSLQEIIKTGVSLDGQLTSELLQAIFYSGNPLHDGAAVILNDRIMAAGCILPLTQRQLYAQRRLGTRHRASVGLSETCDALIVVVSEETGHISVAYHGRLHSHLDSALLRANLVKFYEPSKTPPLTLSSGQIFEWLKQKFWEHPQLPSWRYFLANLGILFFSILISIGLWTLVSDRTNPIEEYEIANIALHIENIPAGSMLMKPLPTLVSALVQTRFNTRNDIDASSFQATISLANLSPGRHHLPVPIKPLVSRVRVLASKPQALDLELAEIISRTIEVTINLPDQENLSPAYRIISPPTASPSHVKITGPAPLVAQVSQVEATILLASASASLQEVRSLRALDSTGNEIKGVIISPNQTKVNVMVARRLNTVEVGVLGVTAGTLPSGYWLSGISVTPASVTLQGNVEQLSKITGFVDTLPVDLSQASGNLKVRVPLNVPANIQVLDSNGNAVKTVTVSVEVTMRSGDLVVTRQVELFSVQDGLMVTVEPPKVDLLLSGPLPILHEIESNPNMVRVMVNASSLITDDQITDLTPMIIVPATIQAQPAPPLVRVTSSR